MLEALVAAGVAAMFMSAIVSLVIISNQTSDRATEYQLVTWNALEGLEALKSIAFDDLANTENGALTMVGSRWTITTGPQSLDFGMSRTLHVRDVQRDTSCNVVTSGGTVDSDSKYLISDITWIDTANRNHTLTQEALRTRWDNPQGSCFGPSQQSAYVTFDVGNSEFYGGSQLRDLAITNTGDASATIDKITFTWDNGATIEQLFIDNSKIWSKTGPGTPTGSQSSGTELNVEDFTMSPGITYQLNKGQFSTSMGGTTLTMTVVFSDGSIFTSEPFMPQ